MHSESLLDLTAADRAFALAARRRLRETEGLDMLESARLSATRARARDLVAAPARGLPAWSWLAAPAVMAIAAVVLLHSRAGMQDRPDPSELAMAGTVNAPEASALDWLSDEAGPDFYRDLEFYEWLQSRSPSKPNA